MAATIPESLLLQLETLIRLCPNIAQPPIPEKHPIKYLLHPEL
jgi:hypothetical protein